MGDLVGLVTIVYLVSQIIPNTGKILAGLRQWRSGRKPKDTCHEPRH